MDAQVSAALVSGGAAPTVAVLGIGDAIAAQLLTARHAFKDSLALQEAQYARQEHERREQSRREDAYRFAEQRRRAYGNFVRLARDFLHAVDVEHSAAESLEHIDRQRDHAQPGSHGHETSTETAQRLVAVAGERKRCLHSEFGTACEEIYLLGSLEVRQAADRLWEKAHRATDSADSDYTDARIAFLEAARHELGITKSQQSLHIGASAS